MAVTLTEASSPWYQAPSSAGGEDYSTDEALTGGTWINGEPIYKKTITGTSHATGGMAKAVAHSINGLGTMVRMDITLCGASGTYYQSFASSNGAYLIFGIVDATNFTLTTGTDPEYCSRPFWVTIYYVKGS